MLATAWAADPHPLVQRAAVAGLCEPRLLTAPDAAARALDPCERVTRAFAGQPAAHRADADVRALRNALGYAWSVAVAAAPDIGVARFRALAGYDDRDVAWIMRENAKRSRLAPLLA